MANSVLVRGMLSPWRVHCRRNGSIARSLYFNLFGAKDAVSKAHHSFLQYLTILDRACLLSFLNGSALLGDVQPCAALDAVNCFLKADLTAEVGPCVRLDHVKQRFVIAHQLVRGINQILQPLNIVLG